MKTETKKEEFERKLKYGVQEWEQMPYNFQDGQPCPMGCIISRRIAAPHDYRLDGDCRAPSNEHCCMNIQDKDREIRKQNESADIWATRIG